MVLQRWWWIAKTAMHPTEKWRTYDRFHLIAEILAAIIVIAQSYFVSRGVKLRDFFYILQLIQYSE
jgi:hypothetical protein